MCIPGIFSPIKQPKVVIPPAPPMPRQPEPMPEIKGIELGTLDIGMSKKGRSGRESLTTRGLRAIGSPSLGLNSTVGSSTSSVGLNSIRQQRS